MHFLSVLVTSAPPPVIRHWVAEAGDACRTDKAGQAQPSNERRLTRRPDPGSDAFPDRRALLHRLAGAGAGGPQQSFIPPRSEISAGRDEEAPGPERNKAPQAPLPLSGRSSADGGAARGRGFCGGGPGGPRRQGSERTRELRQPPPEHQRRPAPPPPNLAGPAAHGPGPRPGAGPGPRGPLCSRSGPQKRRLPAAPPGGPGRERGAAHGRRTPAQAIGRAA